MTAFRDAVFRNMQSLFGENRILVTLFVSSLVMHGLVFGALFYHYGDQGFYLSVGEDLDGNDGQHYIILAKNIVEGHGYSRFIDAPYEPDALRTPLLPLYLVPFFYVGGISLLWLAIAVLNVVLAFAPVVLYSLARLFVPHVYAVLAALYLVVDPLYLYRSQLAEPDALFSLLILCAIYLFALYWRSAIARYILLSFMILGLSILAKPSALYVAVIMSVCQVVIIVFFRRTQWRTQAMHLIVGVLIMFAVVSPWIIRNHSVFGVWDVSSITGYNLHDFYTVKQRLPGESVPESIRLSSREPSRYLPNQKYFTDVAFKRIGNAPISYAQEQSMGTLRNLFVSELPVIHYYGHSAILPFRYDPETDVALAQNIPKIMWIAVMILLYLSAFVGMLIALKKDRENCIAFVIFLVLFAYLIFSCGPYVDAKYRMPAIPFLVVMAMYGLQNLSSYVRSRGVVDR